MKRVALIILLCATLTGIWQYTRPKELLGNAEDYKTVTLQLDANLFYDVRVPTEAVLKATDGATIYEYDLLAVGIQDKEPSCPIKAFVGDRWVFAKSDTYHLKATAVGFEVEEPYEGTYDLRRVEWDESIPEVTTALDANILAYLSRGGATMLGGQDFVTCSDMYGTFDACIERACYKMSTLFGQEMEHALLTADTLWISSGGYTVAVETLNYNTCRVYTAHGSLGGQYIAAMIGGV